jgi:hypothetical protein
MRSRRARPLVALLSLALLGVLLAGIPPAARAGGDDFEFGQALAALGTKSGDKAYFDLARRVYQHVIDDPNSAESEKDLCRYGMAEMTRDQAMGATGNDEISYKDVLSLFHDAIATMEAFVKKNPDHPKANEARLQVGTTRLGFVQWARDLLGDKERMKERGTTESELTSDAKEMVEGAIKYFDKLRVGHDKQNATDVQVIAQYDWVLCHYYRALVFEPGTPEAMRALEDAAKKLDDFITLNDGQLVAIFAQDIFGLTRWEQARQTEDVKKKAAFYRKAVEWFETCIETEVTDPESQRVVANGYYHMAQVCSEAGRVGGINFLSMGSQYLEHMEERHPTIWRQDNGVRAMLEWAKIERKRDRKNVAITIANRAADYAKKLGKAWLSALARRVLRVIVAGESGSASGPGVAAASPSVLMRVAGDFYATKEYGKAIAAYQLVLASVRRRPETALEYLVPSWEHISDAYEREGDLVAAALALEPIHALWMDGLVKKVGGPNDENMIKLGRDRLREDALWRKLHTMTGSAIFNQRHQAIQATFTKDYPHHPEGGNTIWNNALQKYTEAVKQLQANNPQWRRTLDDSDKSFDLVAKDNSSSMQDAALRHLIYDQYLREDWKGMLAAFDRAMTFWKGPEAKAQLKQYPNIMQRRKPEMGKAIYWKAEALYRMATAAQEAKNEAEAKRLWDEILKTLDGWHTEYDMLKDDTSTYAGARGLIVFAYIGKGDIPDADKAFRHLLSEDPKYRRLPKITFALASHFNEKAKAIDDQRTAARVELNGTKEKQGVRSRLRQAQADRQHKVEYLVDVRGGLAKDQQLVEVYEKAQKDPKLKQGLQITKKQYDAAKDRIPKEQTQIAQLTEDVNKLDAELDKLEKRAAYLVKFLADKAQELYDPLLRAAGYFWDWDQVQKKVGMQRDPNNVGIFADLYFKAALLRPEVSENWERSKALYEDLLKMSGLTEDDRQMALGRLGTIYARLARNAKEGTPQRAQLVQKALDRMQSSIAILPENNDLVISLLKGDLVVLPWFHDRTKTWYYFPMPRVDSVEAFRKAVADMGRPGGPPVPKLAREDETLRYKSAVRDFQTYVSALPDSEVQRTVKGFETAGFDMRLYHHLARSGVDFRLAMAWIYVHSGSTEHMDKAYNLASSLVTGAYEADEYGEEWWEGQSLRLDALVTGAELYSKDMQPGSQPPVTAVEWATRACEMIRGLNATLPHLGDDVRPQTRPEFKAMLARIKVLCTKLSLPSMDDVLLIPPRPRSPNGGNGGDSKNPKETGK